MSPPNGFCERFHRTVKQEFFQVAFRKMLIERLDQVQAYLDSYLEFHNREHAHPIVTVSDHFGKGYPGWVSLLLG